MESNSEIKDSGLLSNNMFTVGMKDDKQMEKYLTKADEANDTGDEKIEKLNDLDNIDDIVDEEGKNDKPLKQRLFGRIDPGSVRGSIFNLAILSLGSGCLALPQKFKDMSVLVAIIDIVLAGFAAYWTLNLMILASEKYKIFNYSKLVETVFGKGMALFLDLTILIYIFGIMILYQVIAYKLLGGVVNELGGLGYKSIDDFFNNSFWSEYYCRFPVMYGLAFLAAFPLCLMKNISKMRFNSIFGITSLFFLIIIIIIQTPWYISDYWDNVYKEDDPSTHLNLWNISTGFTENLYFFKGTATLFYAYSCHIGAFPVCKELKNNILRRIQKVFKRSILLDAAFYTIVGITGYLSNPVNTPDLIIERYKLFDSDIVMTIGWIAFIFTLIMKIPANYNSFRISLVGLLGYDPSEISDKV